jgi:hypothetical protein
VYYPNIKTLNEALEEVGKLQTDQTMTPEERAARGNELGALLVKLGYVTY